MSGVEILGAVAAGLALAQLCLASARRLSASYSDSRVSETIRTECSTIIKEVDDQLIHMMPGNRPAAQDLRKSLASIVNLIEKRDKRKWVLKWSAKLGFRVYNLDYKDDMIRALQQYQTRTAVIGNAAVEEIRSRVAPVGIPEDMNRLLIPIIESLVTVAFATANVGGMSSQSTRGNEPRRHGNNGRCEKVGKSAYDNFG